jgi:hypothetical protein
MFNLPTLRVALIAAITLCGFTAAHAVVLPYDASMSAEPGVESAGTGYTRVDYDTIAHTLRIRADFTGLTTPTSAAHIHAPTAAPFTGTAGVAIHPPSLLGFPLGVTAGAMDTTFDLTNPSSWNSAYITAHGGTTATAEAAFAQQLADGRAYFNIHTSQYPGGEIRGFYTLIPEPACLPLAALAALTLLTRRRPAPLPLNVKP